MRPFTFYFLDIREKAKYRQRRAQNFPKGPLLFSCLLRENAEKISGIFPFCPYEVQAFGLRKVVVQELLIELNHRMLLVGKAHCATNYQ